MFVFRTHFFPSFNNSQYAFRNTQLIPKSWAQKLKKYKTSLQAKRQKHFFHYLNCIIFIISIIFFIHFYPSHPLLSMSIYRHPFSSIFIRVPPFHPFTHFYQFSSILIDLHPYGHVYPLLSICLHSHPF